MAPPLQIPPPIVDLGRWLAACIANFVHLKHAATSAAQAPVHSEVGTSLQARPIRNWGELAEVASGAAASGITQLVEAMVAHPLGTFAILWVVWESVQQLRKLIGWFRRKRLTRRKRPGPTVRASLKDTNAARQGKSQERDRPTVGEGERRKALYFGDRVASAPASAEDAADKGERPRRRRSVGERGSHGD